MTTAALKPSMRLPDGTTLHRYPAVDVLRGLTVALMIVVNSPGDGPSSYGPLKHAVWHGFTITDLVFPTFLFVVGNAMSFTMKKFEGGGDKMFFSKVLRRTLLIFLIGLFLNAFPFFRYVEPGSYQIIDFTAIRICGVLQRIALCYGIAAIVIHYARINGAVWYCFLSLLGYWVILYFLGDQPDPYTLESNAVSKIDLFILGTKNMYHGEGIPFDPEGLLSTIPAVVNVIGGYFVGVWIQQNKASVQTLFKLFSAGAMLIALALLWDLLFPINKKLWTSSYVLLTIGLDILILCALVFFIEVLNIKRWTYFFEVFGKNPLALYVLSYLIIKLLYVVHVEGLTMKTWIYAKAFLPWSDPENASLIFALSVMLIVWIVGYWMHKKRTYLKV